MWPNRFIASRVFLKCSVKNGYLCQPRVSGFSQIVTFHHSALLSEAVNKANLDFFLNIASNQSSPSTNNTEESSGKETTMNGPRLPLLDSNKISSDGTMSPDESIHLCKDGVYKDVTWQMHIYAHRHNVHITIARPPAWRHPVTGKVYGENPPSRSVALSLCAGRLGFKHSGRKHYDSAFQLGTYVMARMQESGMNSYIERLEVYLRGFGAGREAVTRVLLGVEGKYLRNKIVKVADSTRLKIGGTRSPNPRRLG
ncbi:37S ribosomal protein S18, mitochondrial [Erysiphe necator]|uniref:Putative mitochondrial ribosomal protein subunit s18 n=1 Tax=Uncinula necator TaxID=52586 RepID=A0A0B1P9S7_UNCNE|nr:37S ribosomal protein S18, mitochondrial [Erysiphe necator]KHJ33701.1 putative mitochondrial ribosomal protein subunit s18 [Erysiphe necator]